MSAEPFGITHDGRAVTRYTLGTDGPVTLGVLDLGATVQELWAPDRDGVTANVVLGGTDVADYTDPPTDFLGAVIGRVANRIGGAEVMVSGRPYRLPANDGEHQLHGGPDGLHLRIWAVEHHDEHRIVFTLRSVDGDQGLPGNVRVPVSDVVDKATASVDFEATTDAVTPVSLTQHAHFNLAGEGSGSVDDHLLSVVASRYTPVGPTLIPTGELAEVTGSDLDLRHPVRIGELVRKPHSQLRIGHGLDLNYVLDAIVEGPSAVLHHPASGRTLRLGTDLPGLQLYTGNFFDGSRVGPSGRTYRQGDGIALEPQRFPDAVHHEGAPGWTSVLITPERPYRASLSWEFSAALCTS